MQPIQATIDFTKGLNDTLSTIDQYGSRTYDYNGGRTYDRIFVVSHEYRRDLTQKSVHAFVERSTGALIKAAGWKAPQKNADGTLASRYDLSTPEGMQEALDAAQKSTSYLYL